MRIIIIAILIIILCLTLLSATSWAFTIQPLSTTTTRSSLSTSRSMAEETESVVSAFDAYEQTDDQKTIEFTETRAGSGKTAATDKTVAVAYEGRLMQANKVFDKSDLYVFQVGAGNVIPGWERGIVGMKVGGKRTLRIPPNLAYGDDWYKGTIPPKSHIEFDIELKDVANSPMDEMKLKVEQFGVERAAGMVGIAFFMAVLPAFDQWRMTL